jgi:crotonobetainyl-CoA:carnitine CoA-transferase CaiB-like acyl-CoA transferase
MAMSRPFDGLRVLDLTHVLAGPFCTYLLALLGADTIKIEHPDEPDEVRGRGVDPDLNASLMGTNYQTQASNKRAMTLNFKTEAGCRILKQLAERSDVFVENYRTGALAALGLGYDDVRAVNPRIIYCSLTGFGQTGPRAEVNAYDNVIQAASGLMSLTGTSDVHPLKVGASIVDYAAGLNAAFAIAAALVRRERTGEGVFIDCAMMDTALFLTASHVTAACASSAPQAPPTANQQKEAGLGCYETADSLLMLGAFNKRQHERLWKAFDRPDFRAWSSWTDMATHAPEMRAELTRRLKEKSAAEWEDFFHGIGVPAERVRNVREALEIADTDARRITATLEGGLKVPARPFRFSAGGPEITGKPPVMGEHTNDILMSLGYSKVEIESFRNDGVI